MSEIGKGRYSEIEELPFREKSGNFNFNERIDSLKEIFSHRGLIFLLVKRDVRARYKDSAFGMLWSLVRPITQLLIYFVVIGYFLGAARGIPDFAIYVYSGIAAYSLFSEIISGATHSIVQNSGLVKKVFLPREIFPLASAGSAIFNFIVQISLLVVFVVVTGKFTFGVNLLYVIPGISILLVYGLAFGLILSALNVYMRDVGHLVDVVLMLLMWASPVVYSWGMVQTVLGKGILLDVYSLNPVTLGVLALQKAFWPGAVEAAYPDNLSVTMLIMFVIGVVFLFVAHGIFRRLQGSMAQEL